MWYNNYMKIDRRKLRAWINKNLTPVKVVYDDCFSYINRDQTVTICTELPDHYEEYEAFCKHRGLKYKVHPMVICLLHEIGHDQTLLFLNEFYYTIDHIIDKITGTYSYTELGRKLKYSLYFRSPVEVAATDWLVDFVNNNINEVRELETYVTEG